MQEKRNRQRFILFIVLLAITTTVYLLVHREAKSPVDKTLFRIASNKTDRVEIVSKKDTIKLRVENGKWKVNDAYNADLNMIQVLFATIDQIEPKREVGANQKDSIGRLLQTEGSTVRFFENDNLQLEFQAGGNLRKTEAWYQLTSAMNPYVMVIPGYRVYGSGIFELDANGWRDKLIFNPNWRNFKSLTTTVFKEPSQGFTIVMKQNLLVVDGIPEADTTKLNDYVDAVSLLAGDQFISPGYSPRYDSLGKTQPSFKIEINDIAGRTYFLELYPPLKNDQNILGKLGDSEFILINREKIIPLARKKDYFKKKPAP
jgi:hypothetical protein